MKIIPRKATETDLDLYFNWTNDPDTRSNSFNTQIVDYQIHTNWFLNKIIDEKALLLVFENEEQIPVGQVRIEQKPNENIIGISIDRNFRGFGLAVPILEISCKTFFEEFDEKTIHAYIKKTNLASVKSFQKAGFEEEKELLIDNEPSYLLVKNKKYV
jgi:[ribosomal protein S5]-alanine N-acetyltransferase